MQRKVVKKQTTKTVVMPKAVVKAKSKTTMQSGKATTSPRDKVVKALKAQIMANNREEKAEMKGAKKAIKAPKMAMGMKKYADGTKKVNAPSMAAKKASTMVEPKRKIDATKTMDKFKLDSLNDAEEKRYFQRDLNDMIHSLAVKNRKLSVSDRAKIKSGELNLERNSELFEKRKQDQRNRQDAQLNSEKNAIVSRMENKAKRDKSVLERAVSPKMAKGSGKVKC